MEASESDVAAACEKESGWNVDAVSYSSGDVVSSVWADVAISYE